MNKWPRCKDCVRDNYLREPVCQTCIAGSNFLPRGRSKIYYESVQEMNQPPAAYRATGNTRTAYLAETAIVVGSYAVSSLLSKGMEDQRTAQLAGSAIAVGGTIVNALLAGKAISENRKLRAYYAH